MSAKYHVAIAGATGAVGRMMLSILEERNFPVDRLTLLASARSAGQSLTFKGQPIQVQELREDSFAGVDIALFSAGAGVSLQFAPCAVKAGAVVIDNSSAFRMDKDVPLVVPEVNPHAIRPGIIANPNCSTIQMVVALKPIHDKYRIKRIVVSTYQAVSGSGQKAIAELEQQSRDVLSGKPVQKKVYPHQIAFNCLPHIDVFLDNGYTKEEMKMVNETRKILEDDSILVSPTAVRVSTFHCHSESVNVETEEAICAEDVKTLLRGSPGITVVDNPSQNQYPMAIDAEGKDNVFVGRIRDDLSNKKAINFWVVSDNLRKGAALNAVQIAEQLGRS
ncbi:MAG: aspartate-semialdehyde dehydrogenase [Nitrospinae bacterium CG11_big_fil_rev_8_21_14_0_20_45_15]|nr:MAG: aspartate-semialdehyde dehydrogenase [Nitrospinae bacterium CG11_big_fil_rev_8_21_14_0_20_45_15]